MIPWGPLLYQRQGNTRVTHRPEVPVEREQRYAVRERIGRDQQIERLDGDPSPRQSETQVTCIEPQVARLFQRMTATEQGEHRAAVARRAQTSPKLCKDRSADRRIVQLEQLVNLFAPSPFPKNSIQAEVSTRIIGAFP